MELNQLRCFIAVAEMLHFGHAAQRLDMLPSALGRYIKLLEQELGLRLLSRSTRNVALTPEGALFLDEACQIIERADQMLLRFQKMGRQHSGQLRIGAIDSAAISLVPHLLPHFRTLCPGVSVQLIEDKTARLIPKLKSGRLDLIFIRPGVQHDDALEYRFLLHEEIVLAVPETHALAQLSEIHIEDLIAVPLIVPERRVRPHSYDLTMKVFEHSGYRPTLINMADDKQTIINMVAAGLGAAIMPRWVSRIAVPNVKFIELGPEYAEIKKSLPIAAAWVKGVRDEMRDNIMRIVEAERVDIVARY